MSCWLKFSHPVIIIRLYFLVKREERLCVVCLKSYLFSGGNSMKWFTPVVMAL